MKTANLLVMILVSCLYVNAVPNYMMCAQNLLGSLDMLKVMGNHIKDNNAQALQATVMGFAFDLTMLIQNCDLKFDVNFEKQEFNERNCIRYTKAFYEQIKPLMDKPQELLMDVSLLDKALNSFGRVLGSCGVGLNDSRNKAVEQLIEQTGDLDMNSLLSLLSQFSKNGGAESPVEVINNLRGIYS